MSPLYLFLHFPISGYLCPVSVRAAADMRNPWALRTDHESLYEHAPTYFPDYSGGSLVAAMTNPGPDPCYTNVDPHTTDIWAPNCTHTKTSSCMIIHSPLS